MQAIDRPRRVSKKLTSRLSAAVATVSIAVLGLAMPAQASNSGSWYVDQGSLCGFTTLSGRVAWASTKGYASTWKEQECSRVKVKVKATGLVYNTSTYSGTYRAETPLVESRPSNGLSNVIGWHMVGPSTRNTTN
ncbi:MAG: hypothetical protein LBG60_00810 [Bifidobacteriaceae bacterium]|nr:hypothetical protein [Bifidobacteriaceae bacterium]